MKHLTQKELEAFVLGVPTREAQAFGRHVTACPACAQRLAREARREIALQEAGIEITESPGSISRQLSVSGAWRAPLSVAAALLVITGAFWIVTQRGKSKPAEPAVRPPEVAEGRLLRSERPLVARPGARGEAPRGDVHVSRPPAPAPLASGGEPPGLTEPFSSMPGYDVVSPTDVCRFVTIPLEGTRVP